MNKNRPSGIEADRNKRVVKITWHDNHESKYPFDGMRAICPCVECKGGHGNMGQPPDPKVVRDTPETDLTLNDIRVVGSYAIQCYWSDSHTTGIYSWDYLRNACPCPICLPD